MTIAFRSALRPAYLAVKILVSNTTIFRGDYPVANGNALGGERRDEIVDEMTPADVSKAQAMARECMSSGYEDCGWGWGWW